MATTPFIEREDYDRFLEQEASHFPRATKEAVARLITSSLPDEVQWVADSACEYPEDLFLVDQPPRVLVYERRPISSGASSTSRGRWISPSF